MANEPIPAASAEVLQAQATSGMQGVQAYQQAQATLKQQQQAAVQTAMQEAALRGAPAGAAQSQAGIINAPYDTRLASLAQGQGAYQADMSARDARYKQYEGAVNQARTLVPGEVEKAVAPIRAQGEATVANTVASGRARVDEINSNTQLALAKMQADAEAAARAAARAAASKKASESKLSGTALQAMLSQGVNAKMQATLGSIGSILKGNEAKWSKDSEPVKAIDTATADYRTARDTAAKAGPPQDPKTLQGPYSPQQMAALQAKYQQDLAAWYRKNGGGTAVQNPATITGPYSPAQMTQMQKAYQASLTGGLQDPRTLTGPYSKAQMDKMMKEYQAALAAKSSTPQDPRTITGPYSPAQMKSMTDKYTSGLGRWDSGAAEQAAQAARQRNRDTAAPSYAKMLEANQSGMRFMQSLQTPYGNISADQLSGLAKTDPFSAGLITNAPAPLSSMNIGRFLAGDPDKLGQPDPYSLQAIRAAQESVAGDLSNAGYSISPQDFYNALGGDMKPGESFAQFQARSSGQLSSTDMAAAVAKQNDQAMSEERFKAWKEDRAHDKANQALTDQQLRAKFAKEMGAETNPVTGQPFYDPETGEPTSSSPAKRTEASAQQQMTASYGLAPQNQFGNASNQLAIVQNGDPNAKSFDQAYQTLLNNYGTQNMNSDLWKKKTDKNSDFYQYYEPLTSQQRNLLRHYFLNTYLDPSKSSQAS